MNETTSNGLVLPGDLLGTAEEFVPGHGTYEDHGKIYAALLGHRRVDTSDRAVRVEAVHAIPQVHDGDLVLAKVDEVKSAMAVCTVVGIAKSRRVVPGAPEGTVHISKARDGYTESLSSEFQPGDIVLARVLQSHPTIKLTTAPPQLGVVSARCQVCHGLLQKSGNELECPRCGNQERRKLAKAYGDAAAIEAATDVVGPDH
jgi:exosome complex component CSL4